MSCYLIWAFLIRQIVVYWHDLAWFTYICHVFSAFVFASLFWRSETRSDHVGVPETFIRLVWRENLGAPAGPSSCYLLAVSRNAIHDVRGAHGNKWATNATICGAMSWYHTEALRDTLYESHTMLRIQVVRCLQPNTSHVHSSGETVNVGHFMDTPFLMPRWNHK